MENPIAYVSISNGCCKSGNVRTGAVLIFSFKVSKYFWCLPPHWKICLTLVKACNGAAMEENPEMNFLQYWTTPRKLLTSVTVLSLGQFTITTTLARSTHRWPPPIIWPKYTKEVFANSHLYIFTYNFSFLSTSKTFLTCLMCSSQFLLKIRISSRYTITKSSIRVERHHSWPAWK